MRFFSGASAGKQVLERINKLKLKENPRHCEARKDVEIQWAAWIATSLRCSQ
jgi:hypothetical protein